MRRFTWKGNKETLTRIVLLLLLLLLLLLFARIKTAKRYEGRKNKKARKQKGKTE